MIRLHDNKMMCTPFRGVLKASNTLQRNALYSPAPFSVVKRETEQIKTNTRNYLQTW